MTPSGQSDFVSFVECFDLSGAKYIVRYAVFALDLVEAQEKTIEKLGDARSIPTGPGGVIGSIETVAMAHLTRAEVRRRDVPLFELAR